jgi:hypothetical protein
MREKEARKREAGKRERREKVGERKREKRGKRRRGRINSSYIYIYSIKSASNGVQSMLK